MATQANTNQALTLVNSAAAQLLEIASKLTDLLAKAAPAPPPPPTEEQKKAAAVTTEVNQIIQQANQAAADLQKEAAALQQTPQTPEHEGKEHHASGAVQSASKR